MTESASIQQYYCDDRDGGVREVFDNIEDALEMARVSLAEMYKYAVDDGEWSMGAEDITVGLVAASGEEDDDIVLYRTKLILTPDHEEECYDLKLLPVEVSNDNSMGFTAA